MVRTWSKHGTPLAQTWSNHGPRIVQTWPKYAPNMLQTQFKHAPNMFRICFKYAPDMVQTWSHYASTTLLICSNCAYFSVSRTNIFLPLVHWRTPVPAILTPRLMRRCHIHMSDPKRIAKPTYSTQCTANQWANWQQDCVLIREPGFVFPCFHTPTFHLTVFRRRKSINEHP
jgi:hypothetical protein